MSVHRGCRHRRNLPRPRVEHRVLLMLPDTYRQKSRACRSLMRGLETIPRTGPLQGFRLCELTPPSRKEVKTHSRVRLQVEVKPLMPCMQMHHREEVEVHALRRLHNRPLPGPMSPLNGRCGTSGAHLDCCVRTTMLSFVGRFESSMCVGGTRLRHA